VKLYPYLLASLYSSEIGSPLISSRMTSVAGLPVCWQYFSSFSASCVAKFTVIRFTAHFLLVIIMLFAVCLHHQKEQLTQEEDDKIIRVCVKKQAMPLALKKLSFSNVLIIAQ
jgi:hypothetical protein